MDRGRLEAFSDGVFAVAITLLALVPFATKTVADYLAHGGFDASVAVAVYGIVLEGTSLGFASMLEWSLREGRTRAAVPPDRRWAVRLRFASGGLAYLLVIGGAFLSAPAALGFSGLVAVYYIFERTPALGPGGQDAREGTDERSG